MVVRVMAPFACFLFFFSFVALLFISSMGILSSCSQGGREEDEDRASSSGEQTMLRPQNKLLCLQV